MATVGWLVVSGLFAVYTGAFSSYSKTYGALASIIIVLLWLWLSSLLVLLGAEVDGLREDASYSTPAASPGQADPAHGSEAVDPHSVA